MSLVRYQAILFTSWILLAMGASISNVIGQIPRNIVYFLNPISQEPASQMSLVRFQAILFTSWILLARSQHL